ncbi:MAG: T9SS type A sorting domain-containing protein, partial [Paludibacteraceae bacterium]|nr:T9SS type A sorting domain-containing protein [Paludibacteraceae bacterium]
DPIIPDTSVVDTLPQDTIVIEPIIPDTTQKELLNVVSLKTNGSNINVYPNPATDYVVVSGVEIGDHVTLTSMTGLVLVQCKAESSVVKVDLSELPNGYYLLLNKYRSYKIRKER